MKIRTFILFFIMLGLSVAMAQEVKRKEKKVDETTTLRTKTINAVESTGDSISFKDGEGNTLIKITDEGTVGSITIPSGSASPGTTTNKLYATGLRRSELVKLQWKDIDLKNNIIAVINAKDPERIDYLPIYPELHDFFLEEFPERDGKVFDYTRGDSIRKLFARFLEREKFNHYSIHTLRKTYISRLVNSGLSKYDVMALARHRKIETTLRYYTKIELDRIGREVSKRAKIGTPLGTKIKQPLKLLKTSEN